MAVAALVPVAPQAARRAHQTQFAGRVMLDTIKLLRAQKFAFSAIKIIGKNAGKLMWSQLVKVQTRASVVALLLQVLPVMEPSAPVLRQMINTFINQEMARVNFVAPTARRPTTSTILLCARAQETRL